MEAFDQFCLIFGIMAVGIGLYELFTKQLVGRKLEGVPEKNIRAFLPYDVATYVIGGILLALLGLGDRAPFFQKPPVVTVTILLSLLVIGLNISFGRRFLGGRK